MSSHKKTAPEGAVFNSCNLKSLVLLKAFLQP